MNRAKDTISALKGDDDDVVAKRALSHFPKLLARTNHLTECQESRENGVLSLRKKWRQRRKDLTQGILLE